MHATAKVKLIMTTTSNGSGYVAMAGFGCFAISLFLPSMELNVLGAPTTFSGLQAMAWAIGLGLDWATYSQSTTPLAKVGLVALGLAGILNIIFLAAPVVLIYFSAARRLVKWLTRGAIVGLLLGIVAPFALVASQLHPLTGYFVWLVGYGLLLWSTGWAVRASTPGQ